MNGSIFVRALWGDADTRRLDKVYQEVAALRLSERRRIPFTVYCFGRANERYLRDQGYKVELLNEAPLVAEFLPEGSGARRWWHKLLALEAALRQHEQAVWLDWDVFAIRSMPEDFWERRLSGQPLQSPLLGLHCRRCLWRETDQRKTCFGGWLYCREPRIVAELMELYRQTPQSVDQVVYSRWIDRAQGGWKGPRRYVDDGWDPGCVRLTQRQHRWSKPEADKVLFRAPVRRRLEGKMAERWQAMVRMYHEGERA